MDKLNCDQFQIAILDLSGTETPSDALFGALLRGCTSALTHLNLARNPFRYKKYSDCFRFIINQHCIFSSKKAKDIPSTFKQFFASTLSLQYINLSHCKLPAEGNLLRHNSFFGSYHLYLNSPLFEYSIETLTSWACL